MDLEGDIYLVVTQAIFALDNFYNVGETFPM
jgi:hypothetical protein